MLIYYVTMLVFLFFISVHSSERGGSLTRVLADEVDQRGRSAEWSSSCL